MLCTSSMTYLPEGFKSASRGVLSLIRVKSSSWRSTSMARAMAIKWRTALVEPPRATTHVIAFSKAFLVIISDGRIFFSSSSLTAFPTRSHSLTLSADTAGLLDEKGRDMPSASMADAIVLAVYMPPHAPGPGHALHTMSRRSASSIVPAMYCPYDWKAETISRTSPLEDFPGWIVPPYTIREGLFRRAMAMIVPGIFLSHPGMDTFASYHCADITVSIESAIRSRDWSEKDIPSVPIEIPSDTPIVLN
mmetsp:Transcript_22983/g.45235  ORF Transcript_22983/g.45235 Transcript_22983/m.45235 type:complete len:249 (-) Transcript_22983:422-1168(-)